MCVFVPWWGQLLLQELLYLVDIDFDLAVKGYKRRVGSWSEVLQVSWLPDNTKQKGCNKDGNGITVSVYQATTIDFKYAFLLTPQILKQNYEHHSFL